VFAQVSCNSRCSLRGDDQTAIRSRSGSETKGNSPETKQPSAEILQKSSPPRLGFLRQRIQGQEILEMIMGISQSSSQSRPECSTTPSGLPFEKGVQLYVSGVMGEINSRPIASHTLRCRSPRFWRRIRKWIRVAKERRELASLSDRTLSDLGLSRVDVMQEYGRRFWDMPH
jgi:uncharacterized protein YjiS (DUF1127 family)